MEEIWKNSAIITKRNVDDGQNPISVQLSELKYIIDVHSCIVLNQLPDEFYGIYIDGYTEVYDIEKVSINNYKVDYANGVIYFHPNNIGKILNVDYYGIGHTLLSASRIYTKYDKNGNVLETLEELLDKAKLYIEAIETLGGAVEVINELEQDITNGTSLHENLLEDISTGSAVRDDLEEKTDTANTTINSLVTKTQDGNNTVSQLIEKNAIATEKKQALDVSIQSAIDTNTTLSNTNQAGTQINLTLQQTMAEASDDISKINATGNKSLIIGASNFTNGEYTWTHNMNNDNLIVSILSTDTNEPIIADYKIIDKNNILIRNSAEHPNVKVILSASYYQGNALFGTNIEEFAEDSIGVDVKKVRLIDGNGVAENPITDSDAVFMSDGITKLTEKINSIDTQLEQITYDIRLWGANNDGVTDNTIVFNKIKDAKHIDISNGEYLISQNIVLNCDIRFINGGLIKIRNGATVTINGCITSSINKIFDIDSTSKLIINEEKNPIGYPEYFGAIPNNGLIDCTKAIERSVETFPTTYLQLADYYCNDTVKIKISRRNLFGHSNYQIATNKSSRIIVNSSTKDTMFVGLEQKPLQIYNFVTNVTIKNIELGRSSVPTPVSVGSEILGASGLRVQYCYMCNFEKIRTTEHSNGYVISGTVYCHFKRCTSFRSLQGTTTNNDCFFGFFINGNEDIGMASGNASLYITDCNSAIGGELVFTETIGFLTVGKSSDLFMFRPECSNINIGIKINGDDTKTGNVNIHIINPIVDAFKTCGVYVNDLGSYALIDLSNGYFSPKTTELANYCIKFNQFNGMANLTNNQCVSWQNSLTIGMWVENSTGVVSKNNSYLGVKRPIVLLNSHNLSVEDIINNPQEIATQGAIYIKGLTRSVIKPIIKGGSNVFPQGVFFLDTTGGFNEINCSGIDSSCITGNNLNKVVYNSSQQITTNTTFGNGNITTGIMA